MHIRAHGRQRFLLSVFMTKMYLVDLVIQEQVQLAQEMDQILKLSSMIKMEMR